MWCVECNLLRYDYIDTNAVKQSDILLNLKSVFTWLFGFWLSVYLSICLLKVCHTITFQRVNQFSWNLATLLPCLLYTSRVWIQLRRVKLVKILSWRGGHVISSCFFSATHAKFYGMAEPNTHSRVRSSKVRPMTSVSYTHLDVYKRQVEDIYF